MVMRHFAVHNQKAVQLQKDERVPFKRQHLGNDEVHYNENFVQRKIMIQYHCTLPLLFCIVLFILGLYYFTFYLYLVELY